MAQITITIPDEYVGSGYDTPQYVVLITAERRWNRPEFAALLVKAKEIGEDDEEIGEDSSIRKLLGSVASTIWKESK